MPTNKPDPAPPEGEYEAVETNDVVAEADLRPVQLEKSTPPEPDPLELATLQTDDHRTFEGAFADCTAVDDGEPCEDDSFPGAMTSPGHHHDFEPE